MIFQDNIRVKNSKVGAEFFKLVFGSGDYPYTARISRYCVPGRCDIYSFGYTSKGSIEFWSETGTPLCAALPVVETDLCKKQVVELIRNLFKPHYGIAALLSEVAPKSTAAKLANQLARQSKKVKQ